MKYLVSFKEEKSLTNYTVDTALKKLRGIHRKQKKYHVRIVLLDFPWQENWEGVGTTLWLQTIRRASYSMVVII